MRSEIFGAIVATGLALTAGSGNTVQRDKDGGYNQSVTLWRSNSRDVIPHIKLACPPKTDAEWQQALTVVGETFGRPHQADRKRGYVVNNNTDHPYAPNGRRDVRISSDWGEMIVNISGSCKDGSWESDYTGTYGIMPNECAIPGIAGGVKCSPAIMTSAVTDALNRATAGNY